MNTTTTSTHPNTKNDGMLDTLLIDDETPPKRVHV